MHGSLIFIIIYAHLFIGVNMQGWECCKCGKSYAPHVTECHSCNTQVQPSWPPIQPITTPYLGDMPQYPSYIIPGAIRSFDPMFPFLIQ